MLNRANVQVTFPLLLFQPEWRASCKAGVYKTASLYEESWLQGDWEGHPQLLFLFSLIPEHWGWIKVNMGLGSPQQGTPQLQTLLDSWDTSLENACPALPEKEVFFNPQGKALKINKRSSVINPVTRAYFLGLTAIFSFQAKLRHEWQGTAASESGAGVMIP